MKYYPIDESAARRAKQANSLSDYVEGSATSEYRREVDRAATLAEECKKGKTEQAAKDAYTDDPSCAGPDEEFYIDHVEMVDDDEEDN